MLTPPCRLAVFASGAGTNLAALLERFPPGGPVEVALVVSDQVGAGALKRSRRARVPSAVVRPESHGSGGFGEELVRLLREHRIDLVVLAGYLRKVPRAVIDAFPRRILNVHPALLPRFGGPGMYGERVHRAVIESGERESGATVHFVDADYDTGPVVARATVPVLPGDTPETLAARVLVREHELLPRVVELVARGKVRWIEGEPQLDETRGDSPIDGTFTDPSRDAPFDDTSTDPRGNGPIDGSTRENGREG